MAALREQDQKLVRQVGELGLALTRGFGELAYQQRMTNTTTTTTNTIMTDISPEELAAHPIQLTLQQESLGATLDLLLANPITQKSLCSTCTGELEELRLSLLPEEERAAEGNNVPAGMKNTANNTQRGNPYRDEIASNTVDPSFNRFGSPVRAAHTGAYPQQYQPKSQAQQHQYQQTQSYFVLMNRRSESRVSSVSATPVFGGFRIRPVS
ncbi:hypothetical protein LSM04_008087 [Trypanosoma melophagium]|uniref:uncharacterized protein n=1 Tax=Trypanosoma melophagium TaxID=715481 RepID=UPI00351A4E85|nr:hypothetical protein LSM04_008087 [Trypanosoma melophagium]